jgi:hypothetical protein
LLRNTGADDGTITIPKMDDWSNGDQSQRVAYILSALVDYYWVTQEDQAESLIFRQQMGGNFLLDKHPYSR